jgi:hypothetical protein
MARQLVERIDEAVGHSCPIEALGGDLAIPFAEDRLQLGFELWSVLDSLRIRRKERVFG